jgi:hypothetical protein
MGLLDVGEVGALELSEAGRGSSEVLKVSRKTAVASGVWV